MSETKITKMVVQKEGRKLIFNPAGDIDLSQYYTKSEIDSKFNSYALKSELPNTSDLATKTELNSVKSTATTANNTANSAKTTAQNALNTANSKAANIQTKKHIQQTKGYMSNDGTQDVSAYMNKNLHVKDACLAQVSWTSGTGGGTWGSIQQNGYEIYRFNSSNNGGSVSSSGGGLNTILGSIFFTPSDVIKVTGGTTFRSALSLYAVGTDSFYQY